MNKNLKAKWLKALRSGRYKQTQCALERRDENGKIIGQCCLGVLCRVMKVKPVCSATNQFTYFDGNYGMLSDERLKKAGLTKDEARHLAALNDGDDATFPDIANYIEQNL